jgi:hypothetical protein
VYTRFNTLSIWHSHALIEPTKGAVTSGPASLGEWSPSPELSRIILSLARVEPMKGMASSIELRPARDSAGSVGDRGRDEEISLPGSGLGHVPALMVVAPSIALSEAMRRMVGNVLRMN